MSIPRVMLVLAASGCNALLGIESFDPAAKIDAPIADAMPDAVLLPPGCNAATPSPFALPLVADAYLQANKPPTGMEPSIRIDATSVGLFKFAVGSSKLSTIAFQLTSASSIEGCSVGSASCELCQPATSGSFSVELVRSDWSEATVTWTDPWDVDGIGAGDKLTDACSPTHFATDGMTVVCGPAFQAASVQAGMISVAVRFFDGATGTYAARESACGGAIATLQGRCACGDGNPLPPEECDDGNAIDDDACKNDCTAP